MSQDEKLRYPIGREEDQHAFKKKYSEELKNSLLTEIKMLPSSLEFVIQNLDASQLETPYRPGGWTVQQVVHHVADSHMNAYIRFKVGLTEHNPTIKPYDQEAWANLSDTKKLPVNLSITLLYSLHSRWVQLMEDMDESEWQRTVYHPEREMQLTLWDLLKSYAWHSRHHVAHILQLRERQGWN
ncbi:MAG: YfiT family bacillithiol transferase [Ginsengibacter sp.]